MNSQIFELFFTFFDFFTRHVFDSKSRYIRRLISFEENRFISLEQIFFEQIFLEQILFEQTSLEQFLRARTLSEHSQHDCLREWRNEISVQLNQIMNETTSLFVYSLIQAWSEIMCWVRDPQDNSLNPEWTPQYRSPVSP